MAACPDDGRCHGWSVVYCAGCGSVAPCARRGCPSCDEHPEILQEATERRARKVQWGSKGQSIQLPDRPARPHLTTR